MRYHNITQDDMNNGDGLRVVLWVAGCEHHCKGCQNPVTWNPDDGLVFDKRAFNEIMKVLFVVDLSDLENMSSFRDQCKSLCKSNLCHCNSPP